jgi:cytidylate kinase
LAKFDLVIAIDGTAASGKGTISKKIAHNYSVPHLDTGLLYRFVGYKVLKGFDPVSAVDQLSMSEMEALDLKTLKVYTSFQDDPAEGTEPPDHLIVIACPSI